MCVWYRERERIIFITHFKPLQPKTAITDDLRWNSVFFILFFGLTVCLYVFVSMCVYVHMWKWGYDVIGLQTEMEQGMCVCLFD
jgi:hypothetical protein